MLSLEKNNYVLKLDDGRYRLGPKTFQLGHHYERSLNLTDVVTPFLNRLVDHTGETASFYVREGDTRVCLLRRDSPHSVRVSLNQGVAMPLDDTSTGLVLRHFHDARVDSPGIPRDYVRHTSGIVDPLSASMSIPVFGLAEKLVGALTVSGPIGRFDSSDRKMHGFLSACAAELSSTLGSATRYGNAEHFAASPSR
jgi:DNA-binding IclR family transcriptional regulator